MSRLHKFCCEFPSARTACAHAYRLLFRLGASGRAHLPAEGLDLPAGLAQQLLEVGCVRLDLGAALCGVWHCSLCVRAFGPASAPASAALASGLGRQSTLYWRVTLTRAKKKRRQKKLSSPFWGEDVRTAGSLFALLPQKLVLLIAWHHSPQPHGQFYQMRYCCCDVHGSPSSWPPSCASELTGSLPAFKGSAGFRTPT